MPCLVLFSCILLCQVQNVSDAKKKINIKLKILLFHLKSIINQLNTSRIHLTSHPTQSHISPFYLNGHSKAISITSCLNLSESGVDLVVEFPQICLKTKMILKGAVYQLVSICGRSLDVYGWITVIEESLPRQTKAGLSRKGSLLFFPIFANSPWGYRRKIVLKIGTLDSYGSI